MIDRASSIVIFFFPEPLAKDPRRPMMQRNRIIPSNFDDFI